MNSPISLIVHIDLVIKIHSFVNRNKRHVLSVTDFVQNIWNQCDNNTNFIYKLDHC